jgi:hypothetical protein
MSVQFKDPIDLNQLEIQNVQLQQLGSDPATPVEGQIWHRSDLNRTIIEADSQPETVAWEKETTKESRSTGIFTWSGTKLTRIDATHVSITAGTGHIVDINGDHTDVSWVGDSNLLDAYVGSTSNTFFMIDSTGAIVQQGTLPTPTQQRENLYLGFSVHAPVGTITVATADPCIAVNEMSQVRELLGAFGLINRGVQISANGANTSLNLSAGYFYNLGLGFSTSQTDTSRVSLAPQSPATFQYRTQTGVATGNLTSLEVGYYDVGGTRTAISGTRFSTQRIYVSPSGLVRIAYGQNVYNTMAGANLAVNSESYAPYVPFTTNFALVGLLTLRSNATDITDTAQCVFHPVSIFGESIGAGSGVAVTTLQQAYLNSPEPEILTDSTRGAFSIRRGSASDTDNVFEVLDGAGSLTSYVRGNGSWRTNSYIESKSGYKGVSSTGTVVDFATVSGSTGKTSIDVSSVTTPTVYLGTTALVNNWGFNDVIGIENNNALIAKIHRSSYDPSFEFRVEQVGAFNTAVIEVFGRASGLYQPFKLKSTRTTFDCDEILIPNATSSANAIDIAGVKLWRTTSSLLEMQLHPDTSKSGKFNFNNEDGQVGFFAFDRSNPTWYKMILQASEFEFNTTTGLSKFPSATSSSTAVQIGNGAKWWFSGVNQTDKSITVNAGTGSAYFQGAGGPAQRAWYIGKEYDSDNCKLVTTDPVDFIINGSRRLFVSDTAITATVPVAISELRFGIGDIYYFGDSATDGSWRCYISGANMVFERRVSGTWTNKQTFTG